MRTAAAGKSRTAARGGEELVLWLLLVFLGELAIFGFCMFQQIMTTHDSILGLLQGGTLVPTKMSAQQLLTYLQGNLDKYNRIAYTVAFVTQIVFLGSISPFSPIHNRTLRRIVTAVFFVLEVTSDVWYSAATGTTIGGGFMFIFNLGGGGWLASLSYIVAMSAGSTLVGLAAFHKLGKLLSLLRSNPPASA